jgi:hypothetical protein
VSERVTRRASQVELAEATAALIATMREVEQRVARVGALLTDAAETSQRGRVAMVEQLHRLVADQDVHLDALFAQVERVLAVQLEVEARTEFDEAESATDSQDCARRVSL